MTPQAQPDPVQMLMTLEQRGLLDDIWGKSIHQAILTGYALPSDLEELHRRFAKLRRAELLGDVCPFRAPRLGDQGVCIGKSPDGMWVHHDLTAMATHIACLGATGSGKTCVLYWLISQLIMQGIGIFAVDSYKTDMRSLLPIARRCGRQAAVLQHTDLRWNPIEPDSDDPRGHIERTGSLLARVLQLPDRASMLLRRIIYELCETVGVFRGELQHCPTLFDVHARAKTIDANPQARDALLDRLTSLLMALGPEVLAYRRAWRPSQFLNRVTVLELAGANELIRQLVPTAWLGTMFEAQVRAGAQNSRLRTLCLIDDAQRFLGGDGIGSRDHTPIAELLGLLRTSGISLAANAQTLEGIPQNTLANMTGRIIGRLGIASDWQRAARECGLDHAQHGWIQQHLRPGRFMIHLPSSTWRAPFIVDVPRPKLPSVHEDEINASVQGLDALPVVPATEFAHWTPWGSGTVSSSHASTKQENPPATGAPGEVKPTPVSSALTEHELRLLLAIIEHPFQPMSSYHKVCGMKPADAKRDRESLVAQKLIRTHKAQIKGRGRQPVLLEPTEAGIATAQSHGRQV